MIDKVYLDSSFLIAFLIPEHPFHKQAVKKQKLLKNSQIVISLFVLDEVMFILRKYDLPKAQIAQVLKEVLEVDNVEIISYSGEVQTAEEYIDLWLSNNLKPADTLHLFLMKQSGITSIATFDEDFVKKEKEFEVEVI